MATLIKGNFSEDGDSEVFVASRFTFCIGSDSGEDYGGGTATIYIKHAEDLGWTEAESYTTGSSVATSVDYVGGVIVKLNLSGSTSPDLDYSVKYE